MLLFYFGRAYKIFILKKFIKKVTKNREFWYNNKGVCRHKTLFIPLYSNPLQILQSLQTCHLIYFGQFFFQFDPPQNGLFSKKKHLDAFYTYLHVIKLYICQLSKDMHCSQLQFNHSTHQNSVTSTRARSFPVKPLKKNAWYFASI